MKFTFLPLVAMMALPATAQQPADLPPALLVKEALEHHPSVAAADARLDAARGASDALRVGSHEVSVQGTVSRRTVDREGDYAEFDGTLSRAVRLRGKALLDRKAGQFGVEVASNKAEDARHQAALVLARLWYDWLGASARHRNAAATAINLGDAARAIRRRVTARDASPLEADQAAAAVAAAELRIGEATATRDRARAELAVIFPDLPLPAEAPEIMLEEPTPGAMETLAAQAVSLSHDITAADRDSDRQDALARRARLDRIPDPTVGLRMFRERGGLEKGVGAYLSIPFGGRYRRALADQAGADARAAIAEAAAVRREVEAHAAGDLAETRARVSAWRSSRDAVAQAEAAAAKTMRGQDLGTIDLADRLYADRLAYEARAAEIDARVAAAYAFTKMRIDAHSLWID
jgi:cobalt-zinc-cadmium efflux system outer membrane protein